MSQPSPFGNLHDVLDAPIDELQVVHGIGSVAPVALKLIRAAATVYLQQSAEGTNLDADHESLAAFWRMRIGANANEAFEVADLDSGYCLIRDGVERLEEGTIDRAAVYPRRVVEAALKRGAAAIVLCTFTEKAAFEMRDRLSAAAQKTGFCSDLSELVVSPMHSLCNRLLSQHRHRTALGHNYVTLDDLAQLLFIFDHFDCIIGPDPGGLYLGRWKTRWTAIDGARGYFDKITEELIEPQRLIAANEPFLHRIGSAYFVYERALIENNRVDFAHLQSMIYALLTDAEQGHSLACDIRYVLVDEYQDTNYVQEQLLLKLTEETRNLCVVGDEDQSLYRFRGATVRNILEFPVVVVGSLSTQLSSSKQIDRDLSPFYHRVPFEPEDRITLFDRMRLHYVAFSRPQKVLVLTAHESPKDHFAPIWQGLPQWPYVQQDLSAAQHFQLRERIPVQARLQLHRRPDDLRDVPTAISVFP